MKSIYLYILLLIFTFGCYSKKEITSYDYSTNYYFVSYFFGIGNDTHGYGEYELQHWGNGTLKDLNWNDLEDFRKIIDRDCFSNNANVIILNFQQLYK